MTFALFSTSHAARFSLGRLKTVSSSSRQNLIARVAILWIGSPSSDRTVRIPPVGLSYVPSHYERRERDAAQSRGVTEPTLSSGTPGAATMSSLTLWLVCASLATMTQDPKRKPSKGMRSTP